MNTNNKTDRKREMIKVLKGIETSLETISLLLLLILIAGCNGCISVQIHH